MRILPQWTNIKQNTISLHNFDASDIETVIDKNTELLHFKHDKSVRKYYVDST